MKRYAIYLILLSTLLFSSKPTQESVTKLYIATFDRAPDGAGLSYWVYDSGLSLEEIARSFFEQPETKALYGDKVSDYSKFIDSVYEHLFKREPDSAGKEYWEGELKSQNIPPSTFILAVTNGAKAKDAQVLKNKTAIGLILASKEDFNATLAKEVMKEITSDSDSIAKVLSKVEPLLDKNESYNQDNTITTNSPNLKVTMVTKSDWSEGFCKDINITNSGDSPIEWKVIFNSGGDIYDSWSANFITDDTTHKTTITGLEWNRELKGGNSTTVGYCAHKDFTSMPEATSSDELEIESKFLSKWDSGYCKEVTVKNITDKEIVWSLDLDVDGAIYTIWSANYTQDPQSYELHIKGEDWNKALKPDSNTKFGFCVNSSNSNEVEDNNIDTNINSNNSDNNLTDKNDTTKDLTSNNETKSSSTKDIANNLKSDDSSEDTTPPTTDIPTTNKTSGFTSKEYEDALKLSYEFYEAQRAVGPFPVVTWREPGPKDDGKDVGADLSKGWYDAGDFVKFNLPMAYSSSILEMGILEFGDAYKRADLYDYATSGVRYTLDYYLNAYNPGSDLDSASDDRVYYQVADPNADHSFWGPPQDLNMKRPTYTCDANNRCSEVAAQMSAALAGGYLIFKDKDPNYAKRLLDTAKRLYKYATTYKGNNGYKAANGFYSSYSGYNDELAWAATWLYKATGDTHYLSDAESYYSKTNPSGWALTWDNPGNANSVLLYELTGDSKYAKKVEENLDNAIYKQKRTKGGLVFYDGWGSLRYAANEAFVALSYAKLLPKSNSKRDEYIDFAKSQIDYILGDNPRKSSYIVGYGVNHPINPHHRAAHDSKVHNINNPKNNAHILYGALVGGPKSLDDFDYKDDRRDYQANEVACDYNAGYSGALAGLIELSK